MFFFSLGIFIEFRPSFSSASFFRHEKSAIGQVVTNSAPCLTRKHDSNAAYTTKPRTKAQADSVLSAKNPFPARFYKCLNSLRTGTLFSAPLLTLYGIHWLNYTTFSDFVKRLCAKIDNKFLSVFFKFVSLRHFLSYFSYAPSISARISGLSDSIRQIFRASRGQSERPSTRYRP